jgi:hypothetical protein
MQKSKSKRQFEAALGTANKVVSKAAQAVPVAMAPKPLANKKKHKTPKTSHSPKVHLFLFLCHEICLLVDNLFCLSV